MKTIGNLTHGKTSYFQKATFLNDPSVGYEILNELLPDNWYPEDEPEAWTDICVFDGKYYACFGENDVFASDAKLIYVEIEPTESMIDEFNYYQFDKL